MKLLGEKKAPCATQDAQETKEDFDYDRYYADSTFDPKKEVLKEKRMEDFFRVDSACC